MQIEDLVTYNQRHLRELPVGKERDLILEIIKNLHPFKEKIKKERDAMVNLGEVSVSFQAFQDKQLEKDVSLVISRTLNQ
tara:strand:- start:135 stop:374 length:240 start_codon:yes stop_codon:yes gene_type:complete